MFFQNNTGTVAYMHVGHSKHTGFTKNLYRLYIELRHSTFTFHIYKILTPNTGDPNHSFTNASWHGIKMYYLPYYVRINTLFSSKRN